MFCKFAVVAAFATAAAAAALGSSQCNVGKVECCKTVQSASGKQAQKALGALNIPVGSVQGLVGLNCSPLSALGLGAGANCNATPVCCTGNNFSGLVVIGCSPINVNL